MSFGKRQPEQRLDEAFQDRWRRRFHDFASRSDDDAGIAGWSRTGLEFRVKFFMRLWVPQQIRSGETWLDLGCGAGTYTRILDKQGIRVVGCDYSFVALDKARSRSPASIPWIASDATKLPFRPHVADGVLCFGVVQALADARPAVIQIAGVLKPGGAVWIDALNAWCVPNMLGEWRRKLRGKPPHLRYERPGRLKACLRDAGFDRVALYWMPLAPGRFQAVQRVLDSSLMRSVMRWFPVLGALLSHSFLLVGTKGDDDVA